MKAILISIKPKWVAKILNGEKTIEIRKTMPKCDLPIDVYIYCTKQNARYYIENKIYNSLMNGKVVAKFTLNKVEEIKHDNNGSFYYPYGNIRFMTDALNEHHLLKECCLSFGELHDYLYPNNYKGYAWFISNLVIFDRPRELGEFYITHKYLYHIGRVPTMYPYKIEKAPQSWCYAIVKE